MKKWLAVLMASVLAMNMMACDMSNLSEEDMEYIAQVLDNASAGIEDELQNGDLEDRWEEFTSNLDLDVINPANLHWEELTLEDYEALGISVADLEEAGLVLDELGLGDLEPSDIDLNQLSLIDLQSLGLGDVTLDDLEVTVDLEDMNPSDLFLFLTSLSEEDLEAIGLGGLDLENPDLSNIDLASLDLDKLQEFLGDMGIDPVDLVLSNIDPTSVDLNNPLIKGYILSRLEQEGIDLAALGIDLDAIDLNAIDLEKLGIDLNNFDLENFDLDKLNLDAIDLESLGIKMEDINFENIDLNNPMVKDYVLGMLAEQGVDLASLGVDLDKLDLNAIDLKKLGIDLNDLDPENFDFTKLNLDAIDFDSLGIKPGDLKLENLDLNNPMVKDYVLGMLADEGFDLASLGVDPDKLDLNAIDLKKLGIDLNNFDLENFDLDQLNLDAIDLDSLGIKMEDINFENIDLNNPMVKDYVVGMLAEQGFDLTSLGIDIDDIDLNAIDLEKLGIDLNDLDPENFDFSQLNLDAIDLESLGISMDDINFENLDLNNPMVKDYVVSMLAEEGFDLASLGIDINDIDLNAIDLESLGLDLNDLDLNAFDPSALNLDAIDLEQLGIDFEDLNLEALDLNNPMIKDFIGEQLDAEGIDLESFGLTIDDIDLNNPFIKGMIFGELNPDTLNLAEFDIEDLDLADFGIELDDIDLEDIDLEAFEEALSELDLADVDLADLGIDPADLSLEDLNLDDLSVLIELNDLNDLDLAAFDLENLDPEDLNLNNPFVQEFLLSQIALNDLDLSDVDLGALPLEDLDLDDLEILGLEDLDLADLELSEEDLAELEEELSDLDLENFDFGDLTIGDLAAMGITLEDLEAAGLVPADLMGDLTVLLDGIAQYNAQQQLLSAAAIAVEADAEEQKEEAALEADANEQMDAEIEAIENENEADSEQEETVVAEETAESAHEDDGTITFLPEEKPEITDDVYSAVNYDLLENVTIPAGYSNWYSLVEISGQTDQEIQTIVQGAYEDLDGNDPDSQEYRIGALYETLLDMDARNEVGVEPIMKWIKAYDKAKSLESLERADLKLVKDTMYSSIVSIGIDYDPEDSSRYVISIDSRLHGPNKEIMVKDELEDFRDAYLVYLGECFRAVGYSDVDAVLKGAGAYALQSQYEDHTLSAQELYDPSLTGNIFTQDELEAQFTNLPIEDWLEAMHVTEEDGYDTYRINDLEAMEFLDEMYTDENLELFKDNAIYSVIDRYSDVLNEELYTARRNFVNTVRGVTEDKSLDEQVVDMVDGMLPTDVAMQYTDAYCSKETKKEVTQIVEDIKAAYYALIEENEWMEDETKEKAIEKLDKMKLQVAYPNKWVNYQEDAQILATVDGGSAFENCMSIDLATREAILAAAKEPVDRNEWAETPQTVNAFYNPDENSICLCAAILQGPFYDPDADYATNLGGIGFVIGHEISHAFDANGAQYDSDGSLNMWWTEADWEAFAERRDEVIDYYDGFEVIPGTGICVNGELTVSENMADLGAAKAIERVCDGDQKMFEEAVTNEARCWATKINTDALKLEMNSDVHAPARARVNVPMQMCDLFYDTFSVSEKDGMYVAPEDRIGIW